MWLLALLLADGADGRLEGLGVDPHFLDRASVARMPRDARALEGWPGRAGTSYQPVAVAQHHLAVGADVQEEQRLGRETNLSVFLGDLAQPGAQHAGRNVRAT